MSRDGWEALPRGAMGLSAVCDCGISWSYSLTIWTQYLLISPTIYLEYQTYSKIFEILATPKNIPVAFCTLIFRKDPKMHGNDPEDQSSQGTPPLGVNGWRLSVLAVCQWTILSISVNYLVGELSSRISEWEKQPKLPGWYWEMVNDQNSHERDFDV